VDITSIFVYLKGLIGTIISLLLMLSPIAPAGEAFSAKNADGLITSFSVVSDIHVETNNPDSYNAFRELLAGIKAGENAETAVFLGDNVMNGQEMENIFFYTALKAVKPAENMLVVLGNHDIGNGQGNYSDFLSSYLGYNHGLTGERYEKPYYYKVIDGCYFIVLAAEDTCVNTCVMTEEQLSWLEGVLAEADAADAPIFVFNHHPIYSLEGVAYDSLAKLLSGYDNLIYFYGHTHSPITESSFRTEGGVYTVGLPRSTETVGYEPGNGVVVEVYEDEVIVRTRNFVTGEWNEALEYSYDF